jgi:hypothetical protein
MLSQDIDIGRPHPPHANWARISVGLPEENQRAQDGLRRAWRKLPEKLRRRKMNQGTTFSIEIQLPG